MSQAGSVVDVRSSVAYTCNPSTRVQTDISYSGRFWISFFKFVTKEYGVNEKWRSRRRERGLNNSIHSVRSTHLRV